MTKEEPVMRKAVMSLTLVATLLAIPVFSAQQGLGAARLHPLHQSGIEAEIVILDNGNNHIVFSGRATGLTPGVAYVSLLYDLGSESGPPQETPATAGACEPNPPTDNLSGPQMFIGGWLVDANGNGTLYADKTAAGYTPLGTFDTISIRVGPGVENVLACGQVSAQISNFGQ
jgi:hypothetical protein